MPSSTPQDTAAEAEPEPEGAAEPEPEAAADTGASPDGAREGTETGTVDAPLPPEAAAAGSERLAEVETRVAAAVDAAALVDDPLLEDGPDPMLPKTQAGDFAPGAPDLEVETDPAE